MPKVSTVAEILKAKQPDVYAILALYAGYQPARRGGKVIALDWAKEQAQPVEGSLRAAL